jgi:hypothetical protein
MRGNLKKNKRRETSQAKERIERKSPKRYRQLIELTTVMI